MGNYSWNQSVPLTLTTGGMCHLVAHVAGFHQDGATALVEIDDASGKTIDVDRAFLSGPNLDDKFILEVDNLPAGSYTLKLSLFTDGSIVNDTFRVKLEGPAQSAGSALRHRRP